MAKVKQKVSGCLRTEFYTKAYCRISSYLQTMKNKGYSPLIAIQMTLDGTWREQLPFILLFQWDRHFSWPTNYRVHQVILAAKLIGIDYKNLAVLAVDKLVDPLMYTMHQGGFKLFLWLGVTGW